MTGGSEFHRKDIMAKADRPALRASCHQDVPFEALSAPDRCTTGLRDRAPGIVLWGDSHADHLSPLMQAFGESHPATPTLTRSFSRCPPIADYELLDARAEVCCRRLVRRCSKSRRRTDRRRPAGFRPQIG